MQNLTKYSNRQYTIPRKLIILAPKRTLSDRRVYNIRCANLMWKDEKSRLLIPLSFHTYKQVRRECHGVRSLLLRSIDDACTFSKFNTVRSFGTSSVVRSSDNKNSKENDKKNEKKKEDEDPNTWAIVMRAFMMTLFPVISYFMLAVALKTTKDSEFDNIRDCSWQEFIYQILLKGEVKTIYINEPYSCLEVELQPGAIINGRRARVQYIVQVPDVNTVEEKIRKIEKDYGIRPEDAVHIDYNRTLGMDTSLSTLLIMTLILIIAWRYIKYNIIIKDLNKMLEKRLNRRANFTLVDPQHKKVRGIRFSDVAGLQEAKVEVMEFVDYLKHPDRYKVLGAKIPKGVLLLGPPGCGKTLLAKAVAYEANVPFLSMNGSEFIEMLGGLGAARVRDLFREAKKRAPCIIYIDEIDAIGKKRRDNVQGHDEVGITLNQLLVELDGMSSRDDVILLASTNRPDVLDRALLRRGRFDRHIRIDLPTLSERVEIFKTHLKSIKLDRKPEEYAGYLAHLTPGFTGADIANICNEGALTAATYQKRTVSINELTYAIEKVVSGTAKKSTTLSPSEKRVVAYREAGHVLVGWMLKHTDSFMKVSIVPTTAGKLGFTQFTEPEHKILSKEQILDEMCVQLAARAAENIIFGEISTAAKDELKKVTAKAYAQVKEFGMNSAIGLLSFTKNELDMDTKPLSKKFKNIVDSEARKIVANACNKTNVLLRENKDKLIKIAEELLRKESLTYEDVEKLIGPPPFGKKRIVSYEDFQSAINLTESPVKNSTAA